MSVEVRVPSMGESVTTATVAGWLKKAGEAVKVDESLVALDSDKATVEVPCPVSGILESTLVAEGAEVRVGQVIAMVPSKDLVVVRFGRTSYDRYDTLYDWLGKVMAVFPYVSR